MSPATPNVATLRGETTTSLSPSLNLLSLPPELLREIIQFATRIVTYCDLCPNPFSWPISVGPSMAEYRANLKTKTALKLTSRTFSDIADEFLFDVIVLGKCDGRGQDTASLLDAELTRRFTAPHTSSQKLRTTQLFVLHNGDSSEPLTDVTARIIRHCKELTCFGWSNTSIPDELDPHRNAILDCLPETLRIFHWIGYISLSSLSGYVKRSKKSLHAVRVDYPRYESILNKWVSSVACAINENSNIPYIEDVNLSPSL